jgi:hypothetical protein
MKDANEKRHEYEVDDLLANAVNKEDERTTAEKKNQI